VPPRVHPQVLGYKAADLEEALEQYEQRFAMATDVFLERWEHGAFGDADFDYSRWALLAHARDRARSLEAVQ
jgi:hypothetical protein